MGKALVLGGGGVTGIAWELGLLAGLRETGVDLTDADLVAGTSAGSIVGAQILSGTDLDDLYRSQLVPPGNERPARISRLALAGSGWAVLRSPAPETGRARGQNRLTNGAGLGGRAHSGHRGPVARPRGSRPARPRRGGLTPIRLPVPDTRGGYPCAVATWA
ncbi:patatin-like phospholipase family protein [Nocardiopsis ansamitocini]|uniref:PNPLA domain-containing protein n=1 Tax=Nocardiopsis ansamitocini TaxID=1670832 RepID=A0A9W6P457_9ACTN|nr:hypothetical protein Nans01_11770 [Nocardiopsis ansamitocini]